MTAQERTEAIKEIIGKVNAMTDAEAEHEAISVPFMLSVYELGRRVQAAS